MKESTKLILFAIGIIAVVIAVVIWFNSCSRDSKPEVVYIHDTTIVERLNEVVKRDTVVKWYEKVIYKEVKPEVVYFDRVDSVFIAQYKDHDVMISVRKQGEDLYIYALNEQGKLLKQYVWHGVGSNFTATSQTNNVFVKSQLWYWEGVRAMTNYKLRMTNLKQWKDGDFSAGLNTGINYKGKVDLRLGVERNFTKGENWIGLETGWSFWK